MTKRTSDSPNPLVGIRSALRKLTEIVSAAEQGSVGVTAATVTLTGIVNSGFTVSLLATHRLAE